MNSLELACGMELGVFSFWASFLFLRGRKRCRNTPSQQLGGTLAKEGGARILEMGPPPFGFV